MLVREALQLGGQQLPTRPGLPDPRREALWLLAHAWGVGESSLRLEPARPVPPAVEQRYRRWLERRADGEPAHHLSRSCPFWGRDFLVSPAVLIPRPETELLVAAALSLELADGALVADIGAGSGCIAVTIAAERPQWRVVATDRSLAALAIAQRNRQAHGVALPLLQGDLAVALAGGFDLVLANLPYIPRGLLAELPVEVQHDPAAALDGGAGGLELVQRLLSDLPRLLAPGGSALLELGEDQADAVALQATGLGLREERRVKDLGGCDRLVLLRRPWPPTMRRPAGP